MPADFDGLSARGRSRPGLGGFRGRGARGGVGLAAAARLEPQEHRARDEDRRVGTGQDPNQDGEGEAFEHVARADVEGDGGKEICCCDCCWLKPPPCGCC